ncbi:hypothetical protein RB623_19665 [Mesorhizobium sp. LHD-90]|uniref:hypothetical protein n=1 Tax=Mesorhizobium sp. LHD-90 TaxID=3071414 RepID=UPI0027DFADBF|nr:hypothetical protein [Mesorhizobium sp. LHD-90]MDQ6436282.1 hypothetical protein [Mesorhizobium sp. LHD-90]
MEVKKKRGNLPKPRSIWGDLDLSAVVSDPLGDPHGGSEQAAERHNVDRVATKDRAYTVETGCEIPADDCDLSIVSDGSHAGQLLDAAETMAPAEEPARPARKRIRRGGEPTLPRGQRWKRRLPKVLRRRRDD